MRRIDTQGRFDVWRTEARRLLWAGVRPDDVLWFDGTSGDSLLDLGPDADLPDSGAQLKVPPQFLRLAEYAACHADPERWDALYRLLWRVTQGGTGSDGGLLADASDPDVRRVALFEKQVRFDVHKAKAFVRFQKVTDPEGDRYVAWHRPQHRILALVAPFFARRFSVVRWTILTPHESASWDGASLRLGPGVPESQAPRGEGLEELWRSYYSSVFNPARVKVRAMLKEMPFRYWSTLPEASVIDDLLRTAPKRVEDMVARQATPGISAADFIPDGPVTLPQLREISQACRGCELWKEGTQTVFGHGPAKAKLVMVGEQPGDEEDKQGIPFVGPAGRVLADAMSEVGIDRDDIYVTNAVKHFHHELRGKRRIHIKPGAVHVRACKPWLEQELSLLKPRVVVALGSTAAQAMLGPSFRVTKDRGKPVEAPQWGAPIVATYHPSAILRMPDDRAKEAAFADLVEDLRTAHKLAAG